MIVQSRAPNRILDFGGWTDTHFAHSGRDDRAQQMQEQLLSDLPITDLPVHGAAGYFRLKDNRYFVDPGTGTIQGGDRVFLTNGEYVFHITEQVDIALFADVGNTFHERQKWELSNYRADAGLEFRFEFPRER